MNILFVLSSFAHAAGVERVISDKMNYLAEQGHHVVFVTYEQVGNPLIFPLHPAINYMDMACPYFTLYHNPLFLRILKARSMKRTFLQRLQAIIDEHSVDVLVVPTNASMFMGEIMKAKGVRKVVESHGAFTKTMVSDDFFANVGKKMQLKAIKKCDLLISLTSADAEYWKYHVPKVTNIPNPVMFYIENPDVSLKQNGRIICVGRLTEQKRIDRLIDAFSMIANNYPSWYIDIYGTGERKAELEKQIEQHGLIHRIHLLEPTHQIKDEYLKSQFFVLSSDYEGMPLVLIEAMACGVPCVSTRCPFGPSELIEDGETGLLTDMDSNDLASKMEWMIVHNKERSIMGVKAHQAAARYKKDKVMKEWEAAYISVI